jgi:hypothetical protein
MRTSRVSYAKLTLFKNKNWVVDHRRHEQRASLKKRYARNFAMLSNARKLTPYLLLSHRRSIGAVMAIVKCAKKPKEPITTTATATSIAT